MPRLNTHQTHIESLVIEGSAGLEEINNYINKFINALDSSESELNITNKIDGAPAVVCWHTFLGYPDDSICLKSFVNGAKNAISSQEEIVAKYGDRPNMSKMLNYCLELAKYIPDGEAWQGDCLFTSDTLSEQEINGKDCVTFQPNKVLYAFSEENEGYNKIKNAKFGIAFHTIYKMGENLSQSFNVDPTRLNAPSDIYIMSPALNYSKKKGDYDMTFIESQVAQFDMLKDELEGDPTYHELTENQTFKSFWSIFENQMISDRKRTTIDPETFYEDLKEFCYKRLEKGYNDKVAKLKTDKGKQKAKLDYEAGVEEMNEILSNQDTLVNIVETINCVSDLKMSLLKVINKTPNDYSTYLRHRERGLESTSGEGLAMSDQDGNIVKLVDRSSFSNANRDPDYLAGFQHEELEGI